MSAVEIAREGLCRMIASGELGPGDLLPSEAELCQSLGVSRSSLREAQKMLTVAGALTSLRGGRPRVSEMSADHIMSGLRMVIPLLPLDRFLELFPLREILEGHVAAQAAARMSDEQCRELSELAELLADTEPSDLAQHLDAEFHALIIRAAEDEMISALLETIRRRGRDYRLFEEQFHTELKPVSDQAHRELAAAIWARDPEGARFVAMQHVRATYSWLKAIRPSPNIFEGRDGGDAKDLTEPNAAAPETGTPQPS